MNALITKHGGKRLRQRLGIPKKACNRHLEKVLKYGDYEKSLKSDNFYIIYHSRRYIFILLNHVNVLLITVYPSIKTCYN